MSSKKFLLLASCCMLLFSVTTNAQRKCGAMEHLQQMIADDPDVLQNRNAIEQFTEQFITEGGNNGTRAVVTIPVVVHVVYNTSAQNISDALIFAQIDQLNKDFGRLNSDAGNTPAAFAGLAANTNVQFCLA